MVTATQPNSRLPQAEGPAVAENGGLIRVRCVLSGLTPLLMNAMSEEQLLAIREKRKGAKNASKPTPKEEASSKVYRLASGEPHVPVKNLYACLIGAGQYVRLDGKRQVSTLKTTTLPGMLTIEDTSLPLFHGEKHEPATWQTDIQQGRNPNGGEAVCVIRPRFDDWELRTVLEIDLEQMPLKQAYELVSIAGKRIGLGDFRPKCKGTFGRFVIRQWEQIKE